MEMEIYILAHVMREIRIVVGTSSMFREEDDRAREKSKGGFFFIHNDISRKEGYEHEMKKRVIRKNHNAMNTEKEDRARSNKKTKPRSQERKNPLLRSSISTQHPE